MITKDKILKLFSNIHNGFLFDGQIDIVSVVMKEYEDKNRFYHNLDHIEYMFENCQDTISLELFFAILYHDVVYVPGAKDNEEKSCQYFENDVTELFKAFGPFDDEQVKKLIMLTKDHDPKYLDMVETDEFEIVYLDLKPLLDCDIKRMKKNDKQLFKEFQSTHLHLYKQGRGEFLSNFYYKFHDYLKNPSDFRLYYSQLGDETYNIGVYCGSFNPLHLGHKNIIEKAEKIFDKVILARGTNPEKNTSPAERFALSQKGHEVIDGYDTVFSLFKELKKNNPNDKFTLIRGLRNEYDFQAEENFRTWVQELSKNSIDIVYFFCDKQYEHISSSQLKNLQKSGIDVKRYLV